MIKNKSCLVVTLPLNKFTCIYLLILTIQNRSNGQDSSFSLLTKTKCSYLISSLNPNPQPQKPKTMKNPDANSIIKSSINHHKVNSHSPKISLNSSSSKKNCISKTPIKSWFRVTKASSKTPQTFGCFGPIKHTVRAVKSGLQAESSRARPARINFRLRFWWISLALCWASRQKKGFSQSVHISIKLDITE